MDQERIAEAFRRILEAIGDDPRREGLQETPRRVAEMYAELLSGIDKDPRNELTEGFEEDHRELVVLRDVPFTSLCEHHFLPFFGSAQIGYIPSGRVVGVSKLSRALDVLAKRPQLQERLTNQMANAVQDVLHPQGVAILLRAEHLCLTIRGPRAAGSSVVTFASRGRLASSASARNEFFALVGKA